MKTLKNIITGYDDLEAEKNKLREDIITLLDKSNDIVEINNFIIDVLEEEFRPRYYAKIEKSRNTSAFKSVFEKVKSLCERGVVNVVQR